jgi:hypothetical protein
MDDPEKGRDHYPPLMPWRLKSLPAFERFQPVQDTGAAIAVSLPILRESSSSRVSSCRDERWRIAGSAAW